MQVSRTPHICVFTLAFSPFVGGAEIAVDEVTKRLRDQYRLTILTARFSWRLPRVETRHGITIRRLGIGVQSVDKFLFPLTALWAAMRLHWRTPIACTWAIMANRAGLAALFFRWMHRSIPNILTLQEGDSEDYIQSRARWIGPLYGSMFRAASEITAISRYLSTWPARYRAHVPVTIIPNGVEFDRCAEPLSREDRRKIRQTMGVGENDRVLITVSRLVEKNSIDILIEATARIPNTRTWILGDGPLADQLRAYARTRGIKDRVAFLGTQSQAHVMRHLMAADIFIRPSRSEGLGNAFLEAMAAGVPVIGTAVGGIVDFLDDRKTGFVVRVDDPQHIVEVVEWIWRHPDEVQVVRETGQRLVAEKYNWDAITLQYKKIFDSPRMR